VFRFTNVKQPRPDGRVRLVPKLHRSSAQPYFDSHHSGVATAPPSEVDPSTYGAVVTGGSRLSAGAIIHATVWARVFGLNLVRLEARIEATPAQLKKVERVLPSLNPSAVPFSPTRSGRKRESYAERGLPFPPRQEQIIGRRLHEALDLLNEGAASLAAAGQHQAAYTS
jgi:hypothetical protein